MEGGNEEGFASDQFAVQDGDCTVGVLTGFESDKAVAFGEPGSGVLHHDGTADLADFGEKFSEFFGGEAIGDIFDVDIAFEEFRPLAVFCGSVLNGFHTFRTFHSTTGKQGEVTADFFNDFVVEFLNALESLLVGFKARKAKLSFELFTLGEFRDADNFSEFRQIFLQSISGEIWFEITKKHVRVGSILFTETLFGRFERTHVQFKVVDLRTIHFRNSRICLGIIFKLHESVTHTFSFAGTSDFRGGDCTKLCKDFRQTLVVDILSEILNKNVPVSRFPLRRVTLVPHQPHRFSSGTNGDVVQRVQRLLCVLGAGKIHVAIPQGGLCVKVPTHPHGGHRAVLGEERKQGGLADLRGDVADIECGGGGGFRAKGHTFGGGMGHVRWDGNLRDGRGLSCWISGHSETVNH